MRLRRCAVKVLFLCLALGLWNSPDTWALTASPTSLTYQAVQGGANPPSQSVNVSKSNKRQTTWTASDSATWLVVSPGVGSITDSLQLAVAVNASGLAAGTYSATIVITLFKGGSATIPVTLRITPATTTVPGTIATPTTATLSWEPVISTDLAGYRVYVGTASGAYGPPMNAGTATSYVISNLPIGTYYFVVTAYNTNGGESLPSNEVSKSIY